MVVKYKVHELAKDFDMKSNAVIDLLKQFDETPKKSQTSLTSDELDIIFDRFTTEHSVENFDSFFAAKKPEENPQTEETAEKPQQKHSRILNNERNY